MSFVWEGNCVENLIKTVEAAEGREGQLQKASREAAIRVGEYFIATATKHEFTLTAVAAIIYDTMRKAGL